MQKNTMAVTQHGFTERSLPRVGILIILFGLAAQAESEVLFSDGFDFYQAGAFPSGWNLLYEGSGEAAQIVDTARSVSGPNSLTLTGSSCWSAYAYRPVNIPASNAVVSVTVKVYSAALVAEGCSSALVSVGLFNPKNGPWGTPYGAVIFKPDGYLYAISDFGDGITGDHVRLTTYVPGRWYTIRTDVDLSTRTFSVQIDGERKASGIPIRDLDRGQPSGVHLAAAHGEFPKAWFDDVLVAAESASVRPPEVSGDRRFDGSYFNSEFSFGFRVSGNHGVTTVSNSPLYQVGNVMLRFTPTGPRSFRGEQFCVDGIFHPVTAELSPGGDLEMTIEGCSPNRYKMVRQGDAARESNPKQLPSTDVLGGCGSAKWQRLAVPEYVCFSPYGGTLPWVNVCNIALSTGYTPVYLGEACKAHDSCYGSAGATRSRCDLAFRVLLETTCDMSLTGKMWKYGRRNCRNVASEFYYQVSTKGCDAFKAGQAAAGNVRATCD